MKSRPLLVALAAAALSPAFAGTAPNPYDNTRSPLGMNLIWVTEWESMMPFIDTFKKSRPWSASSGTLDLDPQGWVRSLAAGQSAITTLMSPNTASQRALADKFPSGQYVISFDGSGTLSFGGSAVTGVQSPQAGRRLVTLDFSQPNASFSIRIDATDPGNYLRNIRVFLPGGICNHDPFHHAASATDCAPGAYESNEQVADEFMFYAPFLNNLKQYRVIRYLQTLGLNGSTMSQPSEWRALGAATWWNQVPLEVVTRLANQLGADVWLNIPQRASDALVQHMATQMQTGLEPDLKVYTEAVQRGLEWRVALCPARAVVRRARLPALPGPDPVRQRRHARQRHPVRGLSLAQPGRGLHHRTQPLLFGSHGGGRCHFRQHPGD